MKKQSPSFSITLRLRYPNTVGQLNQIISAVSTAEGSLGTLAVVSSNHQTIVRDISFDSRDVEHAQRIVEAVSRVAGVEVLDVCDRTFAMHVGGKIEVNTKVPLISADELSMAYTPGVARVCRRIHEDREASFEYTIRANTVAVITDGTAVLGLGDIGPEAALPVMEGKAALFKVFGGVNAFPICLDTKNTEEIIKACKQLAPGFGGFNLEDISSPRCVEIEQRLIDELDIPIFHDDQHGTAVVTLAALRNALKLVGKDMDKIRITINGAGAAAYAITRLLQAVGAKHIVLCDRKGIICDVPSDGANLVKKWLAENTNPERLQGGLDDAMVGADVFVGVSAADVLSLDSVKKMADNAIVFAMANPDPEIDPDLAARHARVVATGRSDYPNQINNVLCFPGLFRGVFEVHARVINDEMKIAAADAIAGVVAADELRPDYVIPSVFDKRVAEAVARAVASAAEATGAARR
ncbi:MAG TPA: NAD-dependent malic enzyme [Planctomycetaceae bacterium]|nr:NAD-dependent malic enzyme [Planctomycetaceae bacterium]